MMLPAVVNGLIVILLLVTLGLGWRLHLRLARLRRDDAALERLIEALNAATGRAEAALAGLKATARESKEQLEAGAEAARRVQDDLRLLTTRGDELADRLMAEIGRARAQRLAAPAPVPAAVGEHDQRARPVSAAELERALRALR
jgi:hypothetical protein